MLICRHLRAAAGDKQRAAGVGGGGDVAEVDLPGRGGDRDEVDELLVVCVTGAAEPGDLAGKRARIVRRILDLEAARAGRQEGDIGGAAGEHVDDAVADRDGAAADHAAARDLDEGAEAAGDERAGVDHGAGHERAAAGERREVACAATEVTPLKCQRAGIGERAAHDQRTAAGRRDCRARRRPSRRSKSACWR